ncbi:hypothetical protein [Ottowia thiooxydans]|uniref:hypothetical protein n=1 Tax=Ottowia thiooxydans TaxID=219182 RepID=UPI00048EA08E|nr:hypothetical protein [Ottowia thiooxydans]
MLNHYPRFHEGASTGLVHKIGGLPWGLPAHLWPLCADCERPMSHLGQFPTHSTELDAPALPHAPDEVLFLFKCEWDSGCFFWEHSEGSNQVLSVPRKELGDAPTHPPTIDAQENGEELKVLPELGVTRWIVQEDGVPADVEDDFYDYGRHSELPRDIAHPQGWADQFNTKFGGVPYWTPNGAQGQPDLPPGRLLLQIDSWVIMDDESLSDEVANFCSDGIAYIFIDCSQSPPVFSMIINR